MTSPQPPHNTSDNRSDLDEAFASSLRFAAGRIIADNPALADEIVRQMVPRRADMGLTVRQRQCLGFIRGYLEMSGGISPSYDQIGEFIGLASKSGIHRLIVGLEERGAIRRLPGQARSIQLVNNSPGVGALGPVHPGQ